MKETTDTVVPVTNPDAEVVPELTIEMVKQRYRSVNDQLQKHHEVPIPISQLFLYPVRGIPGIEVSSVELGNHGIRHDRIFLVVSADDKTPLTNGNFPKITTLTQRIVNHGDRMVLIISS